MTRHCKNSPNLFCHVCAKFTPKAQRRNIKPLLKNAYQEYFQRPMANLDKWWTPDQCCSYCYVNLIGVMRGNKKMPFHIPAVWREPRDHTTDCYFCAVNIKAYTTKTKGQSTYPSVPSLDPPVVLSDIRDTPDESTVDVKEDKTPETCEQNQFDKLYYPELKSTDAKAPIPLNQDQLDDLTRDLGLSKEHSELLASRLKQNNLVAPGVRVTRYRTRESSIHRFFIEEPSICYCSDVDGLMESMGIKHNVEEWRLFIDSSCKSLKAVSLHIGNIHPLLPVAYSTSLKENHENIKFLFERI